MQRKDQSSGSKVNACWVFLFLFAGFWGTLPVHADIYGALSEYKKGDYSDSFKDFLALAKLGQPLAQLDVARLYFIGRGVAQNYVYAYAWASVAAVNGEPGGREIADKLEPILPLGSKQVAEQITAPYAPDALGRTLLPELLDPKVAQEQWLAMRKPPCWPVKVFDPGAPVAEMNSNQGRVLVEYTLMPDGTTRLPRVLYGYPPQVFDAATRESVLRSRYAHITGSSPMRCVEWEEFTLQNGPTGAVIAMNGVSDGFGGSSASGMSDRTMMAAVTGRPSGMLYFRNGAPVTHSYSQLLWIERNLQRNAAGGNDPRADLYYGLVIEGAPQLGVSPTTGLSWLVKAAQAGLPLAQFQVGYRLLTGLECRADLAKALKWLHMAADQNETSADVVLATRLLHGTPDAAATARAKDWLERSVAGGNEYGELYLAALLASVPQPQLRDPRRALLLLSKVYPGVDSDPTASEIRAAAQAAEGDFQDAVQSEQGAIVKAHKMGWNLSPLEHRLALYQSRKPWYGDLLAF